MTQALDFLYALLRGTSQVLLQNNVYTGTLVIGGIFLSSISSGFAALIGAISSTLLAYLMGVNKQSLKNGLYGYNGVLVALALLNFFEPTATTWFFIVLASALSTIFMAATTQILEKWKISALTFPFVATTYTFLLVGYRFEIQKRLNEMDSPLVGLELTKYVSELPRVVEGSILGISQIFFQSNFITGIFLLLALYVGSRRSCVMAILGSLIGTLIALVMNIPDHIIRSGIFGFNSALTAIALGSLITAFNFRTIIFILLSLISTIAIHAALEMALKPMGLPVMTLPFILATWIFLLATPLFPRIMSKSRT